MKQRWSNVWIVTPKAFAPADLLIDGDRFAAVVARDTQVGEEWSLVDGGDSVLFPGIIDLLQHGFGAGQYAEMVPGAVASNAALLPAFGVTGFLPSIGCQASGVLEDMLGHLSAECQGAAGARALGIHSEGPCFGSPGAHNPQNIQAPSPDLADRMITAAAGRLKAVTVAPERQGAQAFIERLRGAGVSIHLGHSRARPEDVPRYLAWGIDAVTHMFNVMPTYPPDASGVHVLSLTDALLAEPELPLGLIADGIHVHPQLVRLLAQLPADRVFLETDAMKYAGTGGGEFEFHPGYRVRSRPGEAVRDRSGGLCGSSLTPDEAMRNYLRLGGADLVRAAHATSLVPAQVLGVERQQGSIAPGKLADFVVLERDTLAVTATFVGGLEMYRRGASSDQASRSAAGSSG